CPISAASAPTDRSATRLPRTGTKASQLPRRRRTDNRYVGRADPRLGLPQCEFRLCDGQRLFRPSVSLYWIAPKPDRRATALRLPRPTDRAKLMGGTPSRIYNWSPKV